MFYVIYLLIVANDKFVFVSFLLVKSLNKEKNIKKLLKPVVWSYFVKKVFLKFFPNLQENTCTKFVFNKAAD